jgi:hypothetical protein
VIAPPDTKEDPRPTRQRIRVREPTKANNLADDVLGEFSNDHDEESDAKEEYAYIATPPSRPNAATEPGWKRCLICSSNYEVRAYMRFETVSSLTFTLP